MKRPLGLVAAYVIGALEAMERRKLRTLRVRDQVAAKYRKEVSPGGSLSLSLQLEEEVEIGDSTLVHAVKKGL